ncbi:hypothetical protein BMR05_15145, partial [Methylococcaceae bacterium HT4]
NITSIEYYWGYRSHRAYIAKQMLKESIPYKLKMEITKFVGRGFSPLLNMAVSLVESCWVTRGELTSVGLMFRSEYAK